MALSEQEEFELLSLERERAMAKPSAAQADVRKVENAMPAFTPPPTLGQTVANTAVKGMRMGGPMGVPLAFMGEGMNQANQLLERGAYNAGGAVTDLTGSPATGFAANVGIQAIPAVLSGNVASKLVSPAMESTGTRLMQSAVKPSSADLVSGDAQKAVKTLLDKGINVTPGGMAAIRGRVTALSNEVKEIIKNSGELVNKADAANVERAMNKFRYATLNREANLKSIQQARDEFLSAVDELEPLSRYTGQIPVQLAQKIKTATQRQLSDEFGALSGAQMEAGKDLTHNLRMAIEKAHPEVVGRNAEMTELLNALSVTEKHALQAMNKNPAGLALLAENEKAAMAFLADRSAAFKSIAARMIYSGRERLPQFLGGGAVATYEGSRNTPR